MASRAAAAAVGDAVVALPAERTATRLRAPAPLPTGRLVVIADAGVLLLLATLLLLLLFTGYAERGVDVISGPCQQEIARFERAV